MVRKIITDNTEETLEILKDGERFALIHSIKDSLGCVCNYRILILSLKEATEVTQFIKEKKGGNTDGKNNNN